MLFKKTLHRKYETMIKYLLMIFQLKNQQIKTNSIIKTNIEFLNDKRYIF